MEAIKEYGISLGWVVCFLLLAIVARYVFDWITPFSLRDASAQKNAAIGRVLRGLYLGLAIILAAAMYSTHNILTALRDSGVGIVLMLLMFKIFDLIDRRDFARELADGNAMLGMELEGLFILLSAVIVGAMNYVGG
jgi:putative membrane protein